MYKTIFFGNSTTKGSLVEPLSLLTSPVLSIADPSVIPLPGLSTKKVTSLSKTFGSEAKLLAALKGWGDSER